MSRMYSIQGPFLNMEDYIESAFYWRFFISFINATGILQKNAF